MSDHEFEKQVRHNLDDLKLTPSASAWENIENELRERKRRRTPIIWLPLLLLGLGAGGYFIFTKTSGINTSQQSEKKSQPPDEHITVTKPAGPAVTIQKPASKPIASLAHPSSNNGIKRDAVRDNSPVKRNLYIRKVKSQKKGEQVIAGKPAQVLSNDENELNISAQTEQSDLIADHDPGLDENQIRQEISRQNKIASLKNSLKIKSTDSVQSAVSSVKPPPQKKKNSNKWSFGISAFAGIAAVNEGNFLNFDKPKVEDVSYTPSFSPPASVPSYTPSSITPGISYSVGGIVRRELSRRFSLSAGINYLQLNTRNKVGNQVYGSQVVNNGRTGYLFVYNYFTLEEDRPKEYKNRYHFIEIPLSIITRLNKSEKLPVYWSAGAAVSRLLKSNSLHFDGTTGVYYKNDRLLNLTQAAVTTGFSFELFNKTKRPLWIGPSARYNISKILHKNVAASKNFMSLGLDVKLFIR